MQQKVPLSYRFIQRIKAEEYQRFFSRLDDYQLYMNHLGEVQWMKDKEAAKQHEFFIYNESAWEVVKRKTRLRQKSNLKKLSVAEREIRLKFREYLERTYLGKVQPETLKLLPEEWKFDISDEELRGIPLTLDYFGGIGNWRRFLIFASFLTLIIIVLFYWFENLSQASGGKLLIRCTDEAARVYLDNSIFLGYTNKLITNVPIGIHKISIFKEGYLSIPQYHEIDIKVDSLHTLNFQLNIARSEKFGYLNIFADQKDSRIFVNNIYFGLLEEKQLIALEEGEYNIKVQRNGFVAVPAEKNVRILSGDTSLLHIEQIPLQSDDYYTGSQPTDIGSLDISSNIKNAKIWRNGKDSGMKTDHIFTKMSLGKYVVKIKKEGYKVEPNAIELVLSKNKPARNANFNLTRTIEMVSINTSPIRGKIFIDGELKGEGKFEGQLAVGKHEVTFGEYENYKAPNQKIIRVRAGFPIRLDIDYFPSLRIYAGIDNSGSVFTENCDVFTGYTFRERAFTSSNEGGPSIEFHDKLDDYFWKLGYAFPYRNPKGNDAVKLVFKLPQGLDYNQSFTLKIYAASSREKYPLTLSGNSEVNIKFNNTILSYYYDPKFIEDLGKMEEVEWDITKSIRGGANVLEISTTRKNSNFYYLKKIEIFN
jgi:hypothetical protein